jgi:hypothetical protein
LRKMVKVGGDPTAHLSSGTQESNFHMSYD